MQNLLTTDLRVAQDNFIVWELVLLVFLSLFESKFPSYSYFPNTLAGTSQFVYWIKHWR